MHFYNQLVNIVNNQTTYNNQFINNLCTEDIGNRDLLPASPLPLFQELAVEIVAIILPFAMHANKPSHHAKNKFNDHLIRYQN